MPRNPFSLNRSSWQGTPRRTEKGITLAERRRWARDRWLDAVKLAADHPGDRAYALAVEARRRELDAIPTEERP